MADNLFDFKEKSRKEKLIKSRKATTDLTFKVVQWLNDSQQFRCHRSNNSPGHRISREKKIFEAFDKDGNPIKFEYEDVKIFFKKNNIKDTILDVSGIVLPYNGNEKWAGHHVELECKTGKDTLSTEQAQRIKDIRDAGGISFVFSDMETFLFQIRSFVVDKLKAF